MAGKACVRQSHWSMLSDKIAWRHTGAKQFCQTTLIYYRLQHTKQLSMNLLMNQWFRWLWQVHRLHYVDLLNRCGTRWYIFQRLVRVFQNCSNVGTSECSVTSNSLSMNSLEILSMKSVSMICQWINDLMNEKKSSMKRL